MKTEKRILSFAVAALFMLQLILPVSGFASTNPDVTVNVLKGESYTLPEDITWDVSDASVDTDNVGYHIFTGKDSENNDITYRVNVGEYKTAMEDNLESYGAGKQKTEGTPAGGKFLVSAYSASSNQQIIEEADGNNVLAIGHDISTWDSAYWSVNNAIDDFKLSFKIKVGEYVLDESTTTNAYHNLLDVQLGSGTSYTELLTLRVMAKSKTNEEYKNTEIRLLGHDGTNYQRVINLDNEFADLSYTESTNSDGFTVLKMNNWLNFEIVGNKEKFSLYVNDTLLAEDLLWYSSSTASKELTSGLTKVRFADRASISNTGTNSNALVYVDDIKFTALNCVVDELPVSITDDVEIGENSAQTKSISLLMSDGSYKNFDVNYTVDTTATGEKNAEGTIEGFFANGSPVKIPVSVNVHEEYVTISSIEDIVKSVFAGEEFTLPETVTAQMSNGSEEEKVVVWDADANTENAGVFEFYGTVSGYDQKVKLTLTVKNLLVREAFCNVNENFVLPETLNGKTVTWNSSDYLKTGNVADTKDFGRLLFTGVDKDGTEIHYTLNVARANEIFYEDMEEHTVNSPVLTDSMHPYLSLDGTSCKVESIAAENNKALSVIGKNAWGTFSLVADKISYPVTQDYELKGRVKVDGNTRNSGVMLIIFDTDGKETAGIDFTVASDTSKIMARCGIRVSSTSEGGNQKVLQMKNSGYTMIDNDGEWIDFSIFVDVYNHEYDVYVDDMLICENLPYNLTSTTNGKFLQVQGANRLTSVSETTYIDDLRLTEYVYVTEELPLMLTDNVVKGASGEREQTVMLTLNNGEEEEFTVKYSVDITLSGEQEVTGYIDGFSEGIPVVVNVDLREISEVDDIADTAFVNASYELPKTVVAKMNDGSTMNVNVSWDGSPETDVAGTYEVYGTIPGYSGEVKLTLTVVNDCPVSVDALNYEISRYETFKLPETVSANMKSGEHRDCKVDWSGQIARTDIAGEFTYTGYVVGYQPDVSSNPVAVNLTLKINPVAIVGFRDAEPEILLKRGENLPENIACLYENGQVGFEAVTWDLSALGDGSLDSYNVTGTVEGFGEVVTAEVSYLDVPKAGLTDGLDTAKWDFGDDMFPIGSSLAYGQYSTGNSSYLKCMADPENPDNRVIRYYNNPSLHSDYQMLYSSLNMDEAKSGIAVLEANVYLPQSFNTTFRLRLQASTNQPVVMVDLLADGRKIKDVRGAFPLGKWFKMTIVTDSSDKTSQTYDLYIDGIRVLDDAAWYQAPTDTNKVGENVKIVSFKCFDEDISCYLDEINLYMLNDTLESTLDGIVFENTTITDSIALPTEFGDGIQVAWSSSDEDVISNSGVVTRPEYGQAAKKVSLTVELTKDVGCFDAKVTKEFVFTVSPVGASNGDIIDDALNAISLPLEATDDLSLPTEINNVSIKWASDTEEVIDSSGRIFNPSEDTNVKLTATASYNGNSKTKEFTVKVIYQSELSDKQKIRGVMKEISLPSITGSDLSLPTSDGDVFISWISSNISVMSNSGKLALNRDKTTLTLTGIFTCGEARDEKKYVIEVTANKESGGGLSGGGGGGDSFDSPTVQETPTIVEKPVVESKGFVDISDHVWAQEAINTLAELNVINGVSENEFMPQSNIKREEFAAIIARFLKLDTEIENDKFSDVSEDDWFYKEVLSLYSAGLISGMENNTFGAGLSITRQDMAVILYNAVKENAAQETIEKADFLDYGDISDYACEAINFLYAKGIINGDAGKMKPTSNATRAEAAKMVYEFVKVFYKEKLE